LCGMMMCKASSSIRNGHCRKRLTLH
jgi:hypothetical protein